MNDFKDYRKESKTLWGTTGAIDRECLTVGALLRIADAVEKMALNYDSLINDRNRFRGYYEAEKATTMRLSRSNAALRGHLKKAKAK